MLQALILQQDAVSHIADSLDLEYAEDEQLHDIRETRNNAAGHPSRRGRKPGHAFNHVVRWSLSAHNFELMTFVDFGSIRRRSNEIDRFVYPRHTTLRFSH